MEVNIYDFFDALITRTPWRSEEEKNQYIELVAKWRELNVFGYIADTTTVSDEHTQHYFGGTRR